MLQIKMEFSDLDNASELFKLANSSEDIEIVQEKNFSGDITTIELYISLAINILTLVAPVLKTLIKQRKVSSMKIDGEKIELTNVSTELIEKIVDEKLGIARPCLKNKTCTKTE